MDPFVIAAVIGVSLLGSLLGTVTGLVPGIHVNTLAAILASSYSAISASMMGIFPEEAVPGLVCCCIMSAGVVHSFVDFVPSVYLGAPDSEDAVSVLPGHRLLLSGLGGEAVRSAAIGSLVGCLAALALCIPMQAVMLSGGSDAVSSLTPYILFTVALILIWTGFRRGPKTGALALCAFMLSGLMGYAVMTLPMPHTGVLGEGSLMLPMLTGLFGIPILLSASGRRDIPEQRRGRDDPVGFRPGLIGVITGCIAGWFPGITSTVGASVAACFMPESKPERFIATVASIGTVTSVLALVTLSVSGGGRTGIALAIGDVAGDSVSGQMSETFLMLLLACAVAALAGFWLTIAAGRLMERAVGRIDSGKLNKAVLALVSAIVLLMTGPFGLVLMVFCTVLGFLPEACGFSRTILSGCLLLPVMAFTVFGRAWIRPWT